MHAKHPAIAERWEREGKAAVRPKAKRKLELAPSSVHAPGMMKVKPRKALFVRAQLGPGGSLHVRHTLADGTTEPVVLLAAYGIKQGDEVAPVAAGVKLQGPATWSDGKPVSLVWVQIAEAGAWRGHVSGPFQLTAQTFGEIVANFEKRGVPVAFDLNHVSESDPTEGTLPMEERSKAWGWIHKLENRGESGLWGLVEWLDKTRTMIKAGELKYLSPAIRLQSKDQVSGADQGARISSCAVTNNPVLSHMPGLIAASDAVTHTHSDAFMPHIRACLKCDAMATPMECSDALDRLRMYHKLGDGKATQGVDVPNMLGDMRDRLRVPMTTSDEDLFEQVQSMIDSAIAEHEEKFHDLASAAKLDDAGGDGDDGDEGEGGDAGGDFTMTLEEAMQKIGALENQLALSNTALEGARGQVTQLTDKVAAGEAAIAELGAIRLSQRTAEVDEAVAAYGLTQPKDVLLSMYDKAPAEFGKLFPKKSPKDRLIAANMTGGQRPVPDTVQRVAASQDPDLYHDTETGLYVGPNDDPMDLTEAVMTKLTTLTFGEAQIKAQTLLTMAERKRSNGRH